MDSSKLYPLYSIAECDLYDSSHASKLRIPNIQRGLVWDPIQVELLWDSILRGFPIGSMLVLHHEDGSSSDEILDGQQRANAIINGFDIEGLIHKTDDSSQIKPKSILWYDLTYTPSTDKDEERRIHRICLTNTAHPWGFPTDGSRKLGAEERRNAIKAAYGDNVPSKKSEWDIRRFLPYAYTKSSSFLPIPLAFLVHAAKDKKIINREIPKSFFDDIRELIDIDGDDGFSVLSPWWRDSYGEQIKLFLTKHANDVELFQPFFNLNSYSIPFNYASTQDDIEILFNRVNRRGTPMSPEDLTYAAIKHYGGSLCNCVNISDVIKKACNGLIPEAVLANIVFRYAFSSNNIRGDLSAGDIRKCNSDVIKAHLQYLFSGDNLCSLIDSAKNCILSKDDIPSIMLGEIGLKNPALFVLLLLLVDKHREELGDDFIRSLIIYLYCFSTSTYPISLIFEAAKESPESLKGEIKNILRDSISQEWAIEIPSSFKDYKAAADAKTDTNWNVSNYSKRYGYNCFKALFVYETDQGAFMLKYSLRHYFNAVFGDYSPSNKDLWKDINRPWDHDHIIPKSWVNDSGIWNNCLSAWLNSWGNIADIPFEENRTKNNYADWSYYEILQGDPLLADALYRPYNNSEKMDGLKKGIDQCVAEFISNVWDRFVTISDDFLSLFRVLEISEALSPMQQERQEFLSMVKDNLEHYENGSQYGIYYRTPSGAEIRLNTDDEDIGSWQKPCLSVIKMDDASWRNALSVYILHDKANSRKYKIERGNRKDPDKTPDNIGWWENGTDASSDWLKRPIQRLINKNLTDVEPLPKYFTLGSYILNSIHSELGLRTGFVLNGYAFISFRATIDGILTSISLTWPYYGYYYLEIRSVNQNENLPEKILQYGRDRGYSKISDSSLDLRIQEKDDIKAICNYYSNAVRVFLETLFK